jgi:hypothetical protein
MVQQQLVPNRVGEIIELTHLSARAVIYLNSGGG